MLGCGSIPAAARSRPSRASWSSSAPRRNQQSDRGPVLRCHRSHRDRVDHQPGLLGQRVAAPVRYAAQLLHRGVDRDPCRAQPKRSGGELGGQDWVRAPRGGQPPSFGQEALDVAVCSVARARCRARSPRSASCAAAPDCPRSASGGTEPHVGTTIREHPPAPSTRRARDSAPNTMHGNPTPSVPLG